MELHLTNICRIYHKTTTNGNNCYFILGVDQDGHPRCVYSGGGMYPQRSPVIVTLKDVKVPPPAYGKISTFKYVETPNT